MTVGRSTGMSRRTFMGAAAGVAAGFAAGSRAIAAAPFGRDGEHKRRHDDFEFVEATIAELQRAMRRGQLTSADLTAAYIDRIEQLNPLLHAVIELNPDALAIAHQLDHERRRGHSRGPLHGVPILLKDNIATGDGMQTTAGSLALVGATSPDSPVAARLRSGGAVILGKANLSEWANFRGFAPFNGWSARGGFTRNPYLLSGDPCGSSSGSAVATAANLCAVAVGTETDGSIVCPSGNNLIVGIKPPIGMVPGQGIIPIAHSQDTAGPMGRTVADASLLLSVLAGRRVGELHRGALRHARIGVDRQMFTPELGPGDATNAVVEEAIQVMADLGATIVDTDTGSPLDYGDAEFTVLLWEIKVDMAKYLAGVSNTEMHTLADLIEFNVEHCDEEMRYFGQELFEMAEATGGDLTAPEYVAARALCVQKAGAEGIDAAVERDHLDAIVAPSFSWGSTPAAVAGYPSLSVPVGINADGLPAGMWMYGPRNSTGRLIRLAYDLEQEVQARVQPTYVGSVPPEPPDAGLCAAPPVAATSMRSASTGRPMHWHL